MTEFSSKPTEGKNELCKRYLCKNNFSEMTK